MTSRHRAWYAQLFVHDLIRTSQPWALHTTQMAVRENGCCVGVGTEERGGDGHVAVAVVVVVVDVAMFLCAPCDKMRCLFANHCKSEASSNRRRPIRAK